MNTTARDEVPFILISISTEEFATFRDNFTDENEDFEIGTSVEIHIDNPKSLLGVFTRFEFNMQGQPVMVLKCGCHFKIDRAFWQNQISENQITLPAGLITHLLVLTIGTGRGIIHSKKPQWLEKAILPTLNISGLFQEDMVFDLDKEEEE